MTETVVHVTTLEQWKSVLDVWFARGYKWNFGSKSYYEEYFERGQRFIRLISNGRILQGNFNLSPYDQYSEFMAQQKEDNKMETYYVKQEQLSLIKELKSLPAPLVAIMNKKYGIETLYNELPLNDIEWFNYLSSDNKIEFKVKEPLYRLWSIDEYGEKVYFKQSHGFWTAPATQISEDIFTAPLEEIKKWQTPAWEIEKVPHGK